MRIIFLCIALFTATFIFSQARIVNKPESSNRVANKNEAGDKKPLATIDLYRAISLDRDTTYIDTSLTIQKMYSHNYLRRDLFGLLAFANEGQTYNTLQYGLKSITALPEFGFSAKHFNFSEANQLRYYSVATPVTELYFKSVMQKGQNVDAFFTMNTSPGFNFSIAYKGLRSNGYYVNQLTSTGNFRFTASYVSQNKRYLANAHYTGQDIMNEENGGIVNPKDFESGDVNFIERNRLLVYLNDARSFLKGKRFFVDHNFRINTVAGANNLYLAHQFNYENKFFEYNQPTVESSIGSTSISRFGDSYKTSGINDQTRYNRIYNKVQLVYENTTIGKFNFFIDDFFSNFYYNQILILDDQLVPASLNRRIVSYGGQYNYKKDKWTGKFLFTRSFTNQSLSDIDANLQFDVDEQTTVRFRYRTLNKLPNDNYNLYQSSFVAYNWSNNFKNEKINSITVDAVSPWVDVAINYSILNDHLYFEDASTNKQIALSQQIVTPSQYANTINYISVKASKEFKFGKFALDNTVLYQKVGQSDFVLNVPELVTRNTLYFSEDLFRRALFFQTGISFNYFTKYYANEYNPVVGEFFVQNQKKIGDYANFDFFFNARIQRTRVYLTLEHFNSSVIGYQYYSSPNNPYRDFMIRIGLVWNFFK